MAKVKVRDGELLSKENIKRVIQLLTQEKPITKKEACQNLNISYNTARLAKIIEDFETTEQYASTMRKKLRSTPISKQDEGYIVSAYLDGTALSEISETTFRSVDKVKTVLHRYNVPLRQSTNDYFNPPMIEDKALAKDYQEGDLVFSVRYGVPAYITSMYQIHGTHGEVYSITLVGENRQNAYQPWYELADLREIQLELDIKLYDLSQEEVNSILRDTLARVNKRAK